MARCTCILFLELLRDFPDGPFAEVPGNWRSAGGYGIQRRHTIFPWRYCPSCGGQLGRYRPELADAYRRHRDAIAGPYAPLLQGALDRAEFEGACVAQGATLVQTDATDSIAYRDDASATRLVTTYDPDRDLWYGRAEFTPDPSLRTDPFLPDPKT